MEIGILGLPQSGKTTIFNALTKAGIAAENYPFCTIAPNVGVVEVPDERLAKLAGGVAVIKVGAPTEVAMKEKKARVEDALNATRAAVEEGIVPGGGVVLLRAMVALDTLRLSGDEKTGASIIRRALEEPIRQIAENAGAEGSIVVQKVKEGSGSFGFNAETEDYEDLMAAGIIDPTKVTRVALQHAASIAGLMVTTECLITELPEDQKAPPMPPGGGGMGDMY